MTDNTGNTPRATERPSHVKPPAHWKSEPVPAPRPADPKAEDIAEKSPVRYGDWEINGIAIDF